MSLTIALQNIERGQLRVMHVRGAISALALIVAALIVEIVFGDALPVRGVLGGVALLLGIWLAVIAPPRRWRHWRYAFTGTELHVAHGWWTQVHTIVPVLRVQHIDVAQGPLERNFGVARLVLHTAGSDNTIVTLPGITRETAEEIRDAIRARIGSAA
ncbi:PH domain-containing protein [Sphingomonas sp. HF-S4]|uniref:PH domain-containing protein n=1 Tax=Sphingomonas agrestis TaxID=3080540 RepID=A0ABU3Y5Y5_9SPHN|nr:PH domain-containing protein [Sphingomonas sp. HF-S4]MDV3456752.1 PH domain-containing protein [Sphingomonas sp. HF-S4]